MANMPQLIPHGDWNLFLTLLERYTGPSWAQKERGSLALTADLNAKPLSEGKRDLDKESMLNVFKTAAAYQQFTLEAALKNVDKMSSELKKMTVESQLLLCELILNFTHPVKAKDLREAEENPWSLTD